jgi:flagellar motor protein MotB
MFPQICARHIVLAYPILGLAVEGHTDRVGTDAMNMTLPENRANSVREYFVKQEIAGSSSPVSRSGRRSRSLFNALLILATSCGGRSG